MTGPSLLACSLIELGVDREPFQAQCAVCERRGASFRAELAAVRACEPGDFSSTADPSSSVPGSGVVLVPHGCSACGAAQLAGSARRYSSGDAFSCSFAGLPS